MNLADELQALETELLDPATRSNPQRLTQLLAPEFLEFGSSGRIFTHDQILASLAAEQPAPSLLRLSDFRLLASGPAWALVSFRSHRHDRFGHHAALRSSTWVLRQERWKLLFHQGTKIANPRLTPERNSE